MMVSFSAKIGTRRLLAQGILRAGLPIPCGTVATGSELLLSAPRHFVPITVARQQGNLTPFRSRVPPERQKNPRSLTQDGGLKGCINPHMILTPKNVRTVSKQVFWLSPPLPAFPTGLPVSGALNRKGLNPQQRVRITAAGPLPIFTGFP
jgi:hypothetical protein